MDILNYLAWFVCLQIICINAHNYVAWMTADSWFCIITCPDVAPEKVLLITGCFVDLRCLLGCKPRTAESLKITVHLSLRLTLCCDPVSLILDSVVETSRHHGYPTAMVNYHAVH